MTAPAVDRPGSTVVVDCAAIAHNTEALARFVAPARLFAVVKARAYGHGALEVAGAALDAGADGLCVATTAEAFELAEKMPRRAPIVVLGASDRSDWAAAAGTGLHFVAHSQTELDQLRVSGVPFHVELNTGLNRWGLPALPDDLPANAVGVMTHCAHGHLDPAESARELDTFLAMTAGCRPDLMRHAASSGPLLTSRRAHLDAVRCGQLLLGLWPSVATPAAGLDLRPALSWRSRIIHVHRVRKGDRVGYGGRFRAEDDTWLGVVPVGYADGLPSKLSGSSVLVGTHRAPIVGAISMDCFSVALPGPVPVGSEVTLIGPQISIEDHARHAAMGNVEIAVGLTQAGRRGVLSHTRPTPSLVGVRQ